MAISGGDGSIILTTKVDQSGLDNGIKTMKSSVNSLTSSFTKLGTALGISLGIGALVQFGKQAMQLASDLQEVQNVVDVAFGDMSYKIEKFSKTAIEQFGISQLTAKRTASTYMAMGKGMGIVEDVASDMAITMTGLTADLASFYNMSQERADVILKSVYTGETETLKQLGIVMTEVNLQNFAMSKGITKNLSAMTQQEKTMLRYEYVLEQTALAQGDFARTQDSFANRTRVLSEKWKEMQAIFGETLIILADSFLPVLELVVEKLTIVALYVAAFARGMQGSNKETKKATDNTKQLGTQSNKTANSIKRTTGAVKNLGKETGKTNKQLAQFDDLMVLQTATANDMDSGAGIGDLSGLGGVIAPNFSEELSALESFLDDETMQNLQDFEKWVSDNREGIKTALEIAGLGLLGLAIANVAGKISNLLGLFKKKDKGLDTQTKKTQTETSAVRELSNAWSLAPAFAFGLVPALDALTKSGLEFIPTFQGATDKAYGLIPALDGATVSAYGVSPAIQTATDKSYGLAPAFDTSRESAYGLAPALDGATASATNLSPAFQIATDTVTALDTATAQAMPNVETNIKTALDNSNSNVNAFSSQSKLSFSDWGVAMQGIAIATASVIATNVYNSFNSAGNNIKEFINTSSSNFAKWATNMSENMANMSRNIATNFASALSSAWENFKSFMRATGEKISGFWKEHKATIVTVGVLTGLTVAGIALAPYTGGASLALPALAKGGIVPHATTALIGEKGKEAVLPLENNTEWMDMLADRILMRSGNINIGGGNTEVVLEIDGREFGRAVVEQGNRENRRIGTRLVIA